MSGLQWNADAPKVIQGNYTADNLVCAKCKHSLTEIALKGLRCTTGSHFIGTLGAVRGC
jgi:hypothetical protein